MVSPTVFRDLILNFMRLLPKLVRELTLSQVPAYKSLNVDYHLNRVSRS